MAQGARNGLPPRLAGLLKPSAYPHPVARVKLVTTHLSWVLLAGEWAYKIKRPVRYPFADFSSVELRRHFCDEELRLNRRFAPGLYDRVARVTADEGGARIEGQGPVVDHAVVMRAFGQHEVLAALVEAGAVEPAELAAFGARLADLHAAAPRPEAGDAAGTPVALVAAMSRNLAECLAATRLFGNQAEVALIGGQLRAALARLEPQVEARRQSGHACEGHGDLHMGNVARVAGALQPFDALEFEPSFRWGDAAQDAAMLVADLRAAGRPGLVQAFLNGYLQEGGDYGLLEVLDLYVADRALVRAKVMALLASDVPAAHGQCQQQQAAYLQVATTALAPKSPSCVLMHGPSGAGKSWLAARLAPQLQAVVVRSDLERRRVDDVARRKAEGRGHYAAEAVRAAYARVLQCARAALAGGHSVILDATYARRADRARVAELCRSLGVPLALVDCRAPEPLLAQRISARLRRGDDPSEATLEVLRRQLAGIEPIDASEGLQVVVADTQGEAVPRRVAMQLRRFAAGTPEPAAGAGPGTGARRDCA